MKKLKPIIVKAKYEKAIEKRIADELYRQIFAPIFEILADSKAKQARPATNSKKTNEGPDALRKAIQSGSVGYDGGFFIGTFTARVSRELKGLGAEWNKARKAFKLDQAKVPQDIKIAIRDAREKATATLDQINAMLDAVADRDIEIDFTEEADKTLEDLAGQIEQTLPKDIEVPMAAEGYVADKLQKEYTENLNLYIKKWQAEQIVRLREQVQANTREGFRASNLVEAIKAEYGVSANKAKFLARQETSLLVSKYREENYKEAGVDQYQWSTSHDSRVRGDHKDLNGQIFRWDSPPIVDKNTGRRAHPGEDFGCRCVAIPIVRERI